VGSRFSRRSYKVQKYIDGVRVTPKLLKALADAEQAEAAKIALREKQAMLRKAKHDAEVVAKAEAQKVAEVKIQVGRQADEAKEE
jgi:hypothetical protein